MSYTVRHHYRYEYTAPVSHVQQRLIMVPPDRHGDQVLTAFDLEVRGASGQLATAWQTDGFGNRVCSVSAERVDHAVDFEAWFSVRRDSPQTSLNRDDWRVYRSFTALTMPNEHIRAAAQEIASATRLAADALHRACEWVAQAIDYQPGVTGTRTPAAMALHLGRGVCQDYAHILLSLLRSLRIAARYVSGHLPGRGRAARLGGGAGAGLGRRNGGERVIGCDPTHQCSVGPDYIVVAAGRDFADVTSTQWRVHGRRHRHAALEQARLTRARARECVPVAR